MDPLRIVVTGDIFFEQFFLPQRSASPLGQALPYTAPDEIRAAEATSTFREISGTPLHAEIFEECLQECFRPEDKQNSTTSDEQNDNYDFSIETVPTINDIKNVLVHQPTDNASENETTSISKINRYLRDIFNIGPFPCYLHELSSFPTTDQCGAGTPEKVWRILKSYGELRQDLNKNASNSSHTLTAISQLQKGVEKWLDDVIGTTVNLKPTVVVVNDRNALKEGDAKTNIRTMFNDICKKAKQLHFELPEQDKLLILWHTRSPLFDKDNQLATFLSQRELAKVTIPIINCNCLRDEGVPLRFDISYESVIEQLLASADNHRVMKQLLKFPQILIRFDYGVLHITTNGEGEITGLDIHGLNDGPYHFTGRRGIVFRTTTLLIWSILREVCQCGVSNFLKKSKKVVHPTLRNNTPLDRAIDVGLVLARMHYLKGFGEYREENGTPVPPEHFSKESTKNIYVELVKSLLEFAPDFQNVGSTQENGNQDYSFFLSAKADAVVPRLTRMCVDIDYILSVRKKKKVPDEAQLALLSRILLLPTVFPAQRVKEDGKFGNNNDMDSILYEIVTKGLERVLAKTPSNKKVGNYREPSVCCPFVQWGDYVSIDYRDIDTCISLRNLVDNYVNQENWRSPLAVAVFGKPGSGKNYIVRTILGSIEGCVYDKTLECNIAQWTHLDKLTRQFHKIQDRTVKDHAGDQKIPIVLFDEFDAPFKNQKVGWLKFFLMPLQDGLYVDENDTFRFGKSIFVFAGGVSKSHQDFVKRFGNLSKQKASDFLSRIRGHVNVQDISFKMTDEEKTLDPKKNFKIDSAKIRRAVVLRAMLQKYVPQVINPAKTTAVHPAIVAAFLGIPKFRHGVRSMEAIIQMSQVPTSALSFQPSALPTSPQLDMHVDAKMFLDIVDKYQS
ncbi:MAG: hypothetical protein K8R46_12275 [Pirellulales bacterium]|nr:hypothetical protein [Pirellulales bacterium]